ncbi:MAG: hypothetical protein A3A81_05105 [Omnitrophica bacterium RIFCSPLOWO2_01_FULL_45_10b]|nr:MAG: hypothetical protein A3A81_05105 [Omnitrophica bacterium RIFCSPLOWO2_01_FULL_45_10b]
MATKEKAPLSFLLVSAFLILTLLVAKQVMRPLDLVVTQAVQHFGFKVLDYVMYFFTLFGSVEFTSFALLVVSWHFYNKYQWPGVFLYLFFFMALSGVEFIWKYVVASTIPNPEFDRNPFNWNIIPIQVPYSFPSGHTFRGIFLLGIWWQRLNQKYVPAAGNIPIQKTIILALVFGIGISRIYLGDHWLSDVAGGALLAMIGLQLTSQSLHHELRPA